MKNPINSLFGIRLILTMEYLTRRAYGNNCVQEVRQTYLKKSLEEKRTLYKCKSNYVELKDIPTWTEYYNKYLKNSKDNHEIKALTNCSLNEKISIFEGDITTLEIDAIVNAANNQCLGGGGVDGAIHRAASNLLYDECKTLNGCKTGDAKITAGYNLPARYVIHTVGPRGYKPDLLQSAYINSLNLAIKNQIKTIAFPCISTGVYGYPNKKAANEVVELVRDYLQENSDKFERIIFCIFLPEDRGYYEKFLSMYFPVGVENSECNLVSSSVEPPKIKKPSGHQPEFKPAGKKDDL